MRLFQKVGLAVVLGTAGAACCVAKGTRVRTKRGERLVEALEVGDEVTCVDPVTQARVSSTLTATRTAHRECVTLQTSRGALRCTTDHPLYDPDSTTWADAGDWALGKRTALLWVPEDDTAPLERVVVQPGASVTLEQVFDLTVEHELHDFVANGLLVHNKSPPRPRCLVDGGARGAFELRLPSWLHADGQRVKVASSSAAASPRTGVTRAAQTVASTAVWTAGPDPFSCRCPRPKALLHRACGSASCPSPRRHNLPWSDSTRARCTTSR
jgi:hypothetical protein